MSDLPQCLKVPEGWRGAMDMKEQKFFIAGFRQCRAQVVEGGMVDLSLIPEGWWLYGLFHNHTPIKRRGEEHVPFDQSGHGFAWACKLQHRTGGLLTEGEGDTPQHALWDAIEAVRQEEKAQEEATDGGD